MQINYFKGTFEKNGVKTTKEWTSTSGTASVLATKVKAQMKAKGYKYCSGSTGTRNR